MTSTFAPPGRVSAAFDSLRAARRIGLMPFVPAGYPSLEATRAILRALPAAGASLIELGIPFSDPIADGPVVQEAFAHALANKIRVSDVLQMMRDLRGSVDIPVVAMVSYSIAFRRGIEQFAAEAHDAGFDGLILPDLPPPEAEDVCKILQAAGLDTILMIAPSTPPRRREEILRLCSGFVYCLSVAGITGERDRLPADLERNLRDLRTLTDLPLAVGFGISKAEHIAQLGAFADGAIVGSAFVRNIRQNIGKPPDEIARAQAEYAKSLLADQLP